MRQISLNNCDLEIANIIQQLFREQQEHQELMMAKDLECEEFKKINLELENEVA